MDMFQSRKYLLVSGSAVACLGAVAFWKVKSKPRVLEVPPNKMKLVLNTETGEDLCQAKLTVIEVDTPLPPPGTVLIKMVAAPINPSDDGAWRKELPDGQPQMCGNEGSGVVVASGGGIKGWSLLGKRVALTGAKTYMEYTCAPTNAVFELPANVRTEDGCSFFINPFTVVGIVDTVKKRSARAFIHTGAASQLGQMMVKYCKTQGVTLVSVVRRPEQVEVLKALGADYIVDTSTENWEADLKKIIEEHHVHIAFDCIAGKMTGTLLELLPRKSTVFVYGRLSHEQCRDIRPLDLIYAQKTLEGFHLPTWMHGRGGLRDLLKNIRTVKLVGSLLHTVFSSDFVDTSMEDALEDYKKLLASGRTGKKMRVRFDV